MAARDRHENGGADQVGITLTERWKRDEEGRMVLSLLDASGNEVAGAICSPEGDYDVVSDGCGILCDENDPANWWLRRMDDSGQWPSVPDDIDLDEDGVYEGTITLRP
jgi:hypothetical protein